MARKKFVDEFYLINIKKHKEFTGKVNGRHFALVGPNGAGKTSIFQVIRRLIAALPDSEKPEVWLKKGEEAGEMTIKLVNNGDVYFVSEKINNKPGSRSRIKLWKENGDRRDELTPAQTRLAEIFGAVEDLTPIIDMTGKEQFEFLKARLHIDTTAYEKKRAEMVKERTGYKQKRAAIQSILKDNTVTQEEIEKYAAERDPEKELEKKKDVVSLQNLITGMEQRLKNFDLLRTRQQEIETHINRLQVELAKNKEELKREPHIIKDLEKVREQKKTVTDVNEKIDEGLKTINDHNRMHYKVKFYKEKTVEADSLKILQEEKSAEIKKEDTHFYDRLAATPFGEVYPGLELKYQLKDEESEEKITEEKIGLFLEDLPFNKRQLSYGIMIKCLIKLGVFLNPDGLNFVYISDWNLLDSANQHDLLEFAESQENVQLGIEKVDDRTQVAVEFVEIK